MLHRELGVALRSREAFVAEHFLDCAQVCAFLKHVSAECVAQSVRVDIRRQSFCDSDLFDDPANAARRQPSATLID